MLYCLFLFFRMQERRLLLLFLQLISTKERLKPLSVEKNVFQQLPSNHWTLQSFSKLVQTNQTSWEIHLTLFFYNDICVFVLNVPKCRAFCFPLEKDFPPLWACRSFSAFPSLILLSTKNHNLLQRHARRQLWTNFLI